MTPRKGLFSVTAIRTSTSSRRWLTQAEAAEYLGVSDRTIRNYSRRGLIQAHRLGTRAVRIDVAELERILRPIPTVGNSDA